MNKVTKPNTQELQKLFTCQCSPCIRDSQKCSTEEKVKAEKWTCNKFYSGFAVVTE